MPPAVIGAIGALTLGKAFAGIAVVLALGFISRALSPKPKAPLEPQRVQLEVKGPLITPPPKLLN